MKSLSKLCLLSRMAIYNPREFTDRMEAIVTSRMETLFMKRIKYAAKTAEDGLLAMAETL